jgi:putative endonuclease
LRRTRHRGATRSHYRHHPVARFSRAIRVTQFSSVVDVSFDRQFFVHIMASGPWGTLYVGVTNDVIRRVFEHKQGLAEGFTRKYRVNTLVYFEEWGTALDAIHREKRLKKWTRAWKINLIRTDNPDWVDLAKDWYPKAMTPCEIEAWLKKHAPVAVK